jgi:hypothetical protein
MKMISYGHVLCTGIPCESSSKDILHIRGRRLLPEAAAHGYCYGKDGVIA